jgi:uncharacterized protein (TIGR02996 family)
MSEEDAFLDGIAADRADRTRLLVFADWLADHSDPREEFVRLHVRLLEMDGTEPEFRELDNQWADWTGGIPLMPGYLPGAAAVSRLDSRWLDSICRVFTAGDVIPYHAGDPLQRSATVARHEFGQMDHIFTAGEETAIFYQGKPDSFTSPFAFLAGSILHDLWDDPFRVTSPETDPAGYRFLAPVTRGSFWTRWRGHCAGLRNPPPVPVLTPDNHFLGAQYVEGDWNNWAFVAVHQYDYFGLFWSTTA